MEIETKDQKGNISMPYYKAPATLRDNGIITELRSLDREDTLWLIRFMLNHLEDLSIPIAETPTTDEDPLEALDYLGNLVRSTGKTSEELIAEHLDAKYGTYETVR